jgi:hypothetical protein
MTVSSSTNRVSYAGNGSTTVFPYTYKIFDQDDLTVILRAANGTETAQDDHVGVHGQRRRQRRRRQRDHADSAGVWRDAGDLA